MPNYFSLAQTAILRSGISVSGLAGRTTVNLRGKQMAKGKKKQNSVVKTKKLEYLTILGVFV